MQPQSQSVLMAQNTGVICNDFELNLFNRPPQESGFGWGVFEKNHNSLAEG